MKEKALQDHDNQNIELYVRKEIENEQMWRDRLTRANQKMHNNANHLVSKVEEDQNYRANN